MTNIVKKIIAYSTSVAICVAAVSAFTITSKAGTKTCLHGVGTHTVGATVSSWTGSHDINLGSGKVLHCEWYHWVDNVTYLCDACNEPIGSKEFHHENHSGCGMNY